MLLLYFKLYSTLSSVFDIFICLLNLKGLPKLILDKVFNIWIVWAFFYDMVHSKMILGMI